MPSTRKPSHTITNRLGLLLTGAACIALTASNYAAPLSNPQAATLQTSDVRLDLQAGEHAPQLISLSSPNPQTGRPTIWRNTVEEALPAVVEIRSASVPIRWSFKPGQTTATPHSVIFVYESSQPHLRLHWQWQARAAFGPIEHSIQVENLSSDEIWLPLVDSLRLAWRLSPSSALQHFYVEKSADTPSPQGTHLESIDDHYRWIGRSSTYARPIQGQAREIIPIEFVYESSAPQAGWYAGIEFSGRTRITLERKEGRLSSALGLNNEPGPYRTRLAPHSSFTTPTAFLGAFTSGLDGAGNQLRPWVRAVLNNPHTLQDPQYPLTVSNSWGSGMQVDEALALRMIADAKELGLEMFHLDAGWFRGVGDWYPDPRKFPHGLASIADEAHRLGLRFGIWVDWTQAGTDTAKGALNAHDTDVQDWLLNDISPDWKPEEFKGQTIDIGLPAAKAYATKEVKRIVDDYHLDMLEHDGYLVAQGCTRSDHPHAPPDRSTQHITHDSGFDFVTASNSTDVSYHAVQSYYSIYEQLRQEHPNLLFEICNDGGRMVDFGSAAHGDYFSITDTYDPLSNRRAFYDTSYALPSAMLESYIEKWPILNLNNFRYMLRSGMMGWMTIMLDTTAWTPEQHDAARKAFALYKNRLRPFIRDANLYHVSERPDGIHWDGMEYWDPSTNRGVLYAFRGSIATETQHRFRFSGLSATANYRLHFEDGSSPDQEIQGRELTDAGLQIHLAEPLSSELVFLEEITPTR
jgi:hypothetical protein